MTSLLLDLDGGDRSAFETLVTILNGNLSRLARRHLSMKGDVFGEILGDDHELSVRVVALQGG